MNFLSAFPGAVLRGFFAAFLFLLAGAVHAAPPEAQNVNISGTPEVGFTLTGNYTYFDADGDLEGTSTYRWLRDGAAIGGATGQQYTLVGADEGAFIIFEVTPAAATGETPGSAAESPSVGPIAPANTAPTATNVNITGTTEVGFTLTGNYTYNDADGDLQGASTFRWLRDGAAIGGATGQQYTLVGADESALIRFEVTPVAQTGVSPGTAVQSPAVGPIAAANTAPTATFVNITGTTEVGFTLTGNYTYNDADGDLEGASTYQWTRNNSDIPGANGLQYTLTGADEGRQIRFGVTPAAQSGVSPGATVTSPAVGPIDPANTAPTATNVNITGTTEVGFVLTGNYTYNDADGDLQGASTFRWLRDGAPIGGATGQQYTLVGADEGALIVFEVTPVAQTGVSPGAAVQSPSVGPIAAANTAPTAINVSITGTTEVGFELAGSYTYDDADGDLEGASTFRWLRDGAPIGGATGQQYTLVDVDEGALIVFEVTPVAQTGVSPGAAVQSPSVGPIAAANTAPTASDVSISGTPALGELLTGVYTYNDADGDLEGASTYRWLRDGAPIPGATAVSYTIVVDDIETALRFEVTPIAQTGVTDGLPVQSPDLQVSNSAPSITGQAVLETPEETDIILTLADLTVTDLDSVYPDDFTLTVLDGADYTHIGSVDGKTATITPNLDFEGPLTVGVTVNDGFVDSNVFNLLITVTPVNDVPVFAGVQPPGLTTPEDTTLTILVENLIIVDPDNIFPTDFTLTLTPVADPETANYTLAGETSITPAPNFNGDLLVAATVSDLEAESAPFLIPVTVDPVNDLPVVVAQIGPQQAIEGSPFVLDITANFTDDDENDVLSFSVTWPGGKPPNINFDADTGTFSGTPAFVDTEEPGPNYTVIVTATDLAGEFVSDAFDLTINALGRANLGLVIDVTPDTGLPGDQLRWTFTANNPVGPVAGENVELTGSFIGIGITVSVEGGANCTITLQAASNRANFVCALGGLPVGNTLPIRFTTATSQSTEVIAFATVEGALPTPIDPNLDDNSAVRAVGVAESVSLGAVQNLGSASVRSMAAGDVNGDEVLDLVVGTGAGQPVQVYFGDALRESCQCQRDFLTAPISVPDAGANEGIALADFDGNGALDIAIANGAGQPDTVYGNDGAGNFTLMATLSPSNGNDVAVGDFNDDGNWDIAVAAASPNPVYLGDGGGGFTLHATLGDADSYDVAVGRMDGNTRDDLVFANVGSGSRVWTKNAGAGFTPLGPLPIGDAVAVAAADLNADGFADLVFGRVPTDVGDIPSNPVLLNGSTGVFGNPSSLLGISPTSDVMIGNVNEDALPDIVFVNESGVHQIWVANGGGYVLHPEQIIDIGAVSGILADLGDTDNGDPGGADLAIGGAEFSGVGVYLNDSVGNLGRGDSVSPVITLLGEASLSIQSGTNYVDAGATALDNIDGDIAVSVTSTVNTSVVGNFTVTYNATDFAGNAAEPVVRNVTVTPASGGGGGGGGTISIGLLVILFGFALLRLHRGQLGLTSRMRPVGLREDNDND